MKEQVNMSLFGQFKSVIWSHLYISLISAAFSLGAFWWFITQDFWKELLSIVFTIIYFCVLYSKGSKIGKHDKRGYAQQKAYPAKGLVLSLSIVAITLLLLVLYKVSWNFMTIGGSISTYTGVFYNFIFIIWTFPFQGLMGISNGYIHWFGYFIIFIVPIISVSLGYLAGFHKFSIHDKVTSIVYEKKDK